MVPRALGEAASIRIGDKRAMEEPWQRLAEGAIEQNLLRGGMEQIRSAHHLRDAHRRVIHHDRELIRRHTIFSPDQEIPKIPLREKSLGALSTVDKINDFTRLNPKSPIDFARPIFPARFRAFRSARAGIGRLKFIVGVRRGKRTRHVLATAPTRIDQAPRSEHLPGVEIPRQPLALSNGLTIPIQSRPPQISHERVLELGLASLTVQIFNSKQDRPSGRAGTLVRDAKGSRMPAMQKSGG